MILDKLTDRIQGKVEKLTIEAFDTVSDAEQGRAVKKTFKGLINPETYNREINICLSNESQIPGSSSTPAKFNSISPEQLNFDFLFDDTGIINSDIGAVLKSGGIMDDINDFRNVLIKYEGEIHQPYIVQLSWGKLNFIGRAENISISFKLFNPGGTPIRAVAKVQFRSSESETKREARERKSSPDLTHIQRVKAGDTLPLLCKKIYGNSKYYLQVAAINSLRNFRHLEPGMELVFPPINKSTN